MDEVRVAEMFCGVGGFRLGLERANQDIPSDEDTVWEAPTGRGLPAGRDFAGGGGGVPREFAAPAEGARPKFRVVWANDIDRYCCQVYRRHWDDGTLVEGDVKAIDALSVPDHDLLAAGFPCQSFSLAGKRKGFEDARGTLFYDIARVADAKRPPLLLLENVRGLLSNDGGRTFARILQALDELGYDVEWQVLNSKHFGVPQNRERVFVVGHFRGKCPGEIFPLGVADEVARGKVEERPEVQVEAVPRGGVSTAVDHNYWKGVDRHGQRTLVLNQIGNLYPNEADAGRVYSSNGVARALKGGAGGLGGKTGLYAVESALIQSRGLEARGDGAGHCLKGAGGGTAKNFVAFSNAVDCDGYLRKPGHHYNITGARIRRLTPVECERLQGFPDGWTAEGLTADGRPVKISDTQRYKMMGNAVSVPVIEFLGREILGKCFGGGKTGG